MIQIKAIRTGKQEGYAAVDDFKIIENEECEIFPTDAQPPAPVTTTTVAPVITECDFQNNLCGWIDGGSNFHFNRTDGQILTDLGIDGPNVDHTDSKESKLIIKEEKILKGSLDSIPLPSPSVKIQIMGGKVCLRCKGKTLLGIVH